MGQIDRRDDRPPFRQIADRLRDAIRSGRLAPAERLPSERQLAEEYGVDRATARRAIDRLRAEGLIISHHGKGIFVREAQPVRRTARNRMSQRPQRGFYADLEDAGLAPNVTTTIEQKPAPANIAAMLGVEAGTELLVRSRHMSAGDTPLQLADTWFAPAVVERIPQLREQDTGPGGMYARMEDAGYMLDQRDFVTARVPTPEESKALALDDGVALLHVNRVTADQDGNVLEVTVVRAAGDRNEFVYQV